MAVIINDSSPDSAYLHTSCSTPMCCCTIAEYHWSNSTEISQRILNLTDSYKVRVNFMLWSVPVGFLRNTEVVCLSADLRMPVLFHKNNHPATSGCSYALIRLSKAWGSPLDFLRKPEIALFCQNMQSEACRGHRRSFIAS